jgi:Domain of unknown function (DUF4291)
MNLRTEPYLAQAELWPRAGRQILAQFDAESVVVYQAFRPAIGRFAIANGYFGGDFSLSRMSWIKPNFLWMMYRCGWGEKPEQETVLAVRLQRAAFDELLRQAVPSSFDRDQFASQPEWKAAVAGSSVRLQWDPDHDPSGAPVERRAIQLGLRGEPLARYAREWILAIEDASAFVAEQRANAAARRWEQLRTPAERAYPVADAATARRLGLADGARS